jgi:hypothetical protein
LAFSGTVASFTDVDPTVPASDFTATITWGDGQTGPGTVTAASGGGFYRQQQPHLRPGGPLPAQRNNHGGRRHIRRGRWHRPRRPGRAPAFPPAVRGRLPHARF